MVVGGDVVVGGGDVVVGAAVVVGRTVVVGATARTVVVGAGASVVPGFGADWSTVGDPVASAPDADGPAVASGSPVSPAEGSPKAARSSVSRALLSLPPRRRVVDGRSASGSTTGVSDATAGDTGVSAATAGSAAAGSTAGSVEAVASAGVLGDGSAAGPVDPVEPTGLVGSVAAASGPVVAAAAPESEASAEALAIAVGNRGPRSIVAAMASTEAATTASAPARARDRVCCSAMGPRRGATGTTSSSGVADASAVAGGAGGAGGAGVAVAVVMAVAVVVVTSDASAARVQTRQVRSPRGRSEPHTTQIGIIRSAISRAPRTARRPASAVARTRWCRGAGRHGRGRRCTGTWTERNEFGCSDRPTVGDPVKQRLHALSARAGTTSR